MEEVKVSIIVPVYNAEKYLQTCISSLCSQTLKEIEIILVNDGSVDRSLQICETFAEKDSRIRLISKKNEGQGIARNAGLQIARGEYIGFVDADDYVAENMYEHLYQRAVRDQAQIVISGCRMVYGEDKIIEWFSCFPDGKYSGKEAEQLMDGLIGALPDEKEDTALGMAIWRNLYQRRLIVENQISFVSERVVNSEDLLFNMEVFSAASVFSVLREAFYYYRKSGDSFSSDCKPERFAMFKNLYHQMKKFSETHQWDESRELRIRRTFLENVRICIMEQSRAMRWKVRQSFLRQIRIIAEDQEVEKALLDYPIFQLPKQQSVFFLFLRRKKIWMLIILSKLKELISR